MNKRHLLLIAALASAALYQSSLNPPPAPPKKPDLHAGLMVDSSGSMFKTIDCNTMVATVREAITNHDYGTGTLTLFTPGTAETAYEPVRHPPIALPTTTKRAGMFADNGEEFEIALTAQCKGIEPVPASSLVRAVQLALDDLRGRGGTALLLIQTDLEEGVADHFPRLDNKGIAAVSVCGYANTATGGGPRAERVDALVKKWHGAFTNPAAVRFRPYCSDRVTRAGR